MHILHVIDSLAPGGAERMAVDIANATSQAGARVSVCVTRTRTDLSGELRPDILLHTLNRVGRFDRKAMTRFGRIVREGVDVIHIHGRSSFSFVVFARTLGFLPRRPLLLHDHYGKIEIDSSVPAWFRLWGRRFVGAYVGVSPLLGEWAKTAGLPEEKIHVIENALDLERLRPQTQIDVRDVFRLFSAPIGIVVCGIRPEKGVDLAIEAVAAQVRPLNLLIVGADTDPVYAERCRTLVRERDLGASVTFTGVRSDVPALLASCDFAIMPSRSESGPLTLIEYLAAGLPVVSTRTGSIGIRLADAGVEGFVPPDDPSELTAALGILLALDPITRLERGLAGSRIAADLFAIQRVVPRWMALYESLLRKKRP